MSDTILFAGGRSRILVAGEQTQEAWCLLLMSQPPGNATPPHLHRREIEVALLLSGELTVETGGTVDRVSAGEAAVLPKDRPHRLSNRGSAEARYLLLCAPAGFERFTVDVGERAARDDAPARPMTEADRRRLIDIAPAYGIELLGEHALQEGAPVSEVDGGGSSEDHGLFETIGIRTEVVAATGPDDPDPVLLRAILPPRALIPLHSHPEPECFVVVEGRLDIHVDGVWRTCEAGAHVVIPSGARHAIVNPRDAPTTAITATTLSIAKFLRAAGGPAGLHPPGPPTPEQLRHLLETAVAHGHTFYGPEDQAAAGLPVDAPA